MSEANFYPTVAFVEEVADARLEGMWMRIDRALEKNQVPRFGLALDYVGYWQK